jgi:hypothetical protein
LLIPKVESCNVPAPEVCPIVVPTSGGVRLFSQALALPRRSSRWFVALVLLAVVSTPAAAEVLRLVNWNMANHPNDETDLANLRTVFGHVGEVQRAGTAKPFDILTVAEMDPDSVALVVSTADATYGQPTYTSVLSAADAGGDRTGFVYNAAAVQLVGAAELGGPALTHSVLRGQFRPVGTAGEADVYLYSVHLKSGSTSADRAQRLAEAQALRADADLLGSRPVIFAGDFNWASAFERGTAQTASAWDAFSAPGNGQVFDPVGRVGDWRDNAAYKLLHTNDPGAAMDDRFDLQLISAELRDGLGLDYVNGSYMVLGNNGTHLLDGPITTGTGAPPEVLAALAGFSDHLPVLADYSFTTVPEPASVALWVVAGVLAARRRRVRR